MITAPATIVSVDLAHDAWIVATDAGDEYLVPIAYTLVDPDADADGHAIMIRYCPDDASADYVGLHK